jgi:integrase
MQFCKVSSADELLSIDLQNSTIDYVVMLRENNISHSTIHVLLSAIYHFCEMNDVIINKKKIKKYKGERIRIVKDRCYTHEEIGKILNVSDLRVKLVILLMSSTGVRVGSIPSLRLKHLEKVKVGTDSIYKILVYENTNDEYFSFCTPECAKAIDTYLDYRKINGEALTQQSYLIRKQFDINDLSQIKNSADPVNLSTLRGLIDSSTIRAGLRKVNRTKSKRERKNIPITHVFRKFFTTQLVKSKVNPEIREMLLGHKIGLASAYYRPTEDEIYVEYEKAFDNLTINEENRLRRKVEVLEVEKNRMDRIELQIKDMQQDIRKNRQKL